MHRMDMLRTPLVFSLLLVASLAAQSPGAIHVTDGDGNLVSGNVFTGKKGVWLNAGASPLRSGLAATLADGAYYFQVTDVSGTVLLSCDDVRNREILVVGGRVVMTTGSHSQQSCPQGVIVDLNPHYASPSSCGECRVWITPVAAYDKRGVGFHGFLPECSVTDNFVIPQSTSAGPQSFLAGRVFYDRNENGVEDPTEPLEVRLAGWRVEISLNGVFDGVTFTDANGGYIFTRPLDGTVYEITQVAPPPGYIPAAGATWLDTNGQVQSATANLPIVDGLDFGNIQFELNPGAGFSKGFWHNQGQSLLAACDETWRVALNGPPGAPVCLRTNVSSLDPAVSIFTVPLLPTPFSTAFSTMSNWIVGTPALGHAGYILSNQVAATILNNTCGNMQGTVFIDRFMNGELQSLAGMLADASVLLCDPNAGRTRPQDPTTPSPFDPTISLRDAILACANEFTVINSTSNLNEPQVVYRTKDNADPFLSPYGM